MREVYLMAHINALDITYLSKYNIHLCNMLIICFHNYQLNESCKFEICKKTVKNVASISFKTEKIYG